MSIPDSASRAVLDHQENTPPRSNFSYSAPIAITPGAWIASGPIPPSVALLCT